MTPADTRLAIVDRCVCFEVTFERLREEVERDPCDLYELQRRFACGRGCGMCVPYIRRMMETGETRFEIKLMGQPSSPKE